jgi:hypothetical protein
MRFQKLGKDPQHFDKICYWQCPESGHPQKDAFCVKISDAVDADLGFGGYRLAGIFEKYWVYLGCAEKLEGIYDLGRSSHSLPTS